MESHGIITDADVRIQLHLSFMCAFTNYTFKLLSPAEKMRTSRHVAAVIINELTLAKQNLLQTNYQWKKHIGLFHQKHGIYCY